MSEEVRLKIKARPFNSGGKGGQHSNRTLNAIELSVTLPDGRVIRATSGQHKSQHHNRKVAEKVLLTKVKAALATEPERRSGKPEVIRTYHGVDNRVTDHASGEVRLYRRVLSQRSGKDLDRRLDKLAVSLDPVAGPGDQVLHVSWVSSYRSQPNGVHYARVMAEIRALDPEAAGIPVRVEEAGEGPCGEFRVVVSTDLTGVAILRRRSYVPMREYVRQAWVRGCNPRVYWPGLPHGYEAANGFDYFGRETRRDDQA